MGILQVLRFELRKCQIYLSGVEEMILLIHQLKLNIFGLKTRFCPSHDTKIINSLLIMFAGKNLIFKCNIVEDIIEYHYRIILFTLHKLFNAGLLL